MAEVAGFCPMGCGPTLFLGFGGYVTCSSPDCPQAWAAHRILSDAESEHVVQFEAAGFTLRHPLRERLGDALMRCRLHRWLAEEDDESPRPPGRYRVRPQPPDPVSHSRGTPPWTFEKLEPEKLDA